MRVYIAYVVYGRDNDIEYIWRGYLMHAIVRLGNGKYYISAVFGYYKDITAKGNYERYIQKIHKPYWIVWDEDKKRLIRWQHMVPNTQYIIPQVLIIDIDQSNWNMDSEGVGCVDFLSRELLDSFLDKEDQPEDILQKCRLMDKGYVYEELKEIKDQKDIDDLQCAAGGFHDAFIAKENLQDDGTLHLRFEGVWGCQIEMWLWGDLEYDTSSRHLEDYDYWWYGSTILQEHGFIYFFDDDNMAVDKIGESRCYFKARHMRYRIIPK